MSINIHSTEYSTPIPTSSVKVRRAYSTQNIQAVRRFSNGSNGFMQRPVYRGSSQRIYIEYVDDVHCYR